jgi:hypothetical protein
MLRFTDLLEAAETEALFEKIQPTELYVFESICRSYSVKFSTPLYVVMNELDPYFVIKQHYASQLDDTDLDETLEQFLDSLYNLQDPNHERSKKDEFDSDIKLYEQQEKDRLAKGLPVHKAMRKKTSEKAPTEETLPETEEVPTLTGPTQGFVNFGHLRDDQEK